ncbi:hypothetical protein SNE40_000905 [Patella caerulea]
MEWFRIILVLLLASTYVVSKPLKTTKPTMVANSEVVVDVRTDPSRELPQDPDKLNHVEATPESRTYSKETNFRIHGKQPSVTLPDHMSSSSSELNTNDALSKHISRPNKSSTISKDLNGEGLPIRKKVDPKKPPFITKQKSNIVTPNFSGTLKPEEQGAPPSDQITEMIKNIPNMEMKDVLSLFNMLKHNDQIKNYRNPTTRRAAIKIDNMCCPI